MIMDAHAFEARVPLYRPPRLLQARPRPAHVGSRNDERAAAVAIPQEVHGGGAHDDRLSTRLAVGQVDQSALKIAPFRRRLQRKVAIEPHLRRIFSHGQETH